MVFSWLNTLRLLFLVGLGAFGLWSLRRPPPTGVASKTPRRELRALLLLVAVALILRSVLIPTLPPGIYELENVPYGRVLDELSDQIGYQPLRTTVYRNFHTPLLPTFLDGWFPLGDAIGMGGEIVWLRLPNLLLVAATLLLFVRIGRILGAPAAGWGAAVVFTLSPTLAPLSVYQGHYFLELVTVIWFCERLAQYIEKERPVHRSLAASAALALWTGYMAVLVVLPGMLLYLAVAWRRGDRLRGLAALLLVAAVYGPIATPALDTAFDFLTISVTDEVSRTTAEGIFAVHGHHPMPVEAPGLKGFMNFPLETAGIIYGPIAAVLTLLGMGLALVLRPRVAWLPAALLVLYAVLSTQMSTRWVNFTSVFPFLLLVPLWGVSLLGDRIPWRWAPMTAVTLLSLALVVGPALTPPRYDRLPAPGEVLGWVARGERLSETSKHLQSEANRGLPVVILAVEKDMYYHLCN